VTLGIAYFISGLVSFVRPMSIGALPKIFPSEPLHIGGAVISQEYVWAAGISLFIFILLTLFYKYHRMGIAMRATADDQMAVQACGIPVTSIFSMSWMFACVVAAIGGILISSIGGVSNGLVEIGLKTFSVVILGGLDSFIGAMIAGPIIGIAKSLGTGYVTPYVWPEFGEVIPYFIIIIMVLVKPYGLFGEKRIERI
jgi:branched-chain amino acid transport system permease protein